MIWRYSKWLLPECAPKGRGACAQLAIIGVPPEADSKTRKVKTVYSRGDPSTSRGVGEMRPGREGSKGRMCFQSPYHDGKWELGLTGALWEPAYKTCLRVSLHEEPRSWRILYQLPQITGKRLPQGALILGLVCPVLYASRAGPLLYTKKEKIPWGKEVQMLSVCWAKLTLK